MANSDRDLLARLNSLRQSSIVLEHQRNKPVVLASTRPDNGPTPGQALHADLLSRFKSLSGTGASASRSTRDDGQSRLGKANAAGNDEEEKSIEQILADLGPAEEWDFKKDEQAEATELLRLAQESLEQDRAAGKADDTDPEKGNPETGKSPAIDLSAFKEEPESEDDGEETPNPGIRQHRPTEDEEADEVMRLILDQSKSESIAKPEDCEDGVESEPDDAPPEYTERAPGSDRTIAPTLLDLPTTPSKDPPSASTKPNTGSASARHQVSTEDADADLASRFASLSLPSVPTTMKQPPGSQSVPTSQFKTSAPSYTDADIDTWCIICSDDATLRCIGCDGDLYCTTCWMEGHKGEDAGAEERTHKAVQYVKGGKKKKSRLAIGA